ncbi:hypothetical protein RIF29_13349 [Crotalaria pallida]|uniref:Uncharacterized protein n=1 Tax=Crotalaria pallida TaxID=3830 RepID=A0AAN9IPC2_CROPI
MSSRHNLNHHYKVINEGSPCQESERKYVAKATSGQSFEYEPQAQGPKSLLVTIKDIFDAFYQFSRPYSAIEGAIAVISFCFLSVEKLSDFSPAFFIAMLQINKPYLLIASGKWSFRNGVIVVSSSILLSLCFAWIVGSWPLFWSFLTSAILTGAYSLNTQVFKRPATFSRPVIFCAAIMALYFLVIALFKDIPDVEGDKKFGVKSLAVRLGQKPVLGHGFISLALWYRAKSVDFKSNDSYQSFYVFIWKV